MGGLNIRKNDTVEVISGKDRGKRGRVIEVLPKASKVRVEGVNKVKRHTKPNILVNVIDRPVSFFLGGFPPEVTFLEEFFLNKRAVVLHGNIREELGPHEVRLFRYSS